MLNNTTQQLWKMIMHKFTTILVTTILVMTSSYASAQLGGVTTFRDQYGSNIGSASTSGGNTMFRDQYGSNVGSASTYGGNTTFRDQYGSNVGSASTYGH